MISTAGLRVLPWRVARWRGGVGARGQGGPSRAGSEGLRGISSGMRSQDPVPRLTRTRLVNLGTQAREALDKEAAAVASLVGLKDSVEDMQSLRSLRDGDSDVSVRMVAEILEAATTGLAQVLGQSTQRLPSGLIRYRDPSAEAQQQRYYALGHAREDMAQIAGEDLSPTGSPVSRASPL